ncbi:MAG: carboxypeptidase-like regulatory domain-containing protein [Acidobacteriia bacterium]|nr:carboxypeptidase-like regulatory domain-containing protein [Terriglobia bacterium]
MFVPSSLLFARQAQGQSNRRIPERSPASTATVQGVIRDSQGRAIPGVQLDLRSTANDQHYSAATDVEGIFRLRDVHWGVYEVKLIREGFQRQIIPSFQVSGPVTVLQLALRESDEKLPAARCPSGVPGTPCTSVPAGPTTPYPGLRSPASQGTPAEATPEQIPPDSANFSPDPDRWDIAMPEWRRYERQPDTPYVKGHWYDPFNRSRIKGDYPIFGQRWFFNFTGTSETGFDGRRLPVPSGLNSVDPGGSGFFGRGEQAFVSENLRLSFDLFRGDTSFRPVDFRIRLTPGINLNFLQTRERGLVNIDTRKGTNRLDTHVGLQEGFVEAKLRDLSPNYDFVSLRAGIQQFTSDFRGFLFSEEQPGVRIFGNLCSNRLAYNLAWFHLLEKNTNSGLNTLHNRGQQVYVANFYIQDFLAKGYTSEFSFHYNRDDASVHYDDNGFLVRPAPVGAVVNGTVHPHNIRAYYLGWAGNGHIGRLNVSNAFYQALGHDDFNTIAGRHVNINAQMAALELSVDKDWVRYRASFFYASGDSSSRSGASRTDGTARGFDSIVDNTHFAGTDFSFWDREGIRLTATGVALTTPLSLLPNLRSSKEEGQANFVNPGIYILNLGADFDVTPKLRAFVNSNYLRFDRTEPLELLLFQRPVHHSIGTDFGAGFEYRPPLSENIVVRGGASALVPGQSTEDIYNGRVLFSVFANVKFQF